MRYQIFSALRRPVSGLTATGTALILGFILALGLLNQRLAGACPLR